MLQFPVDGSIYLDISLDKAKISSVVNPFAFQKSRVVVDGSEDGS